MRLKALDLLGFGIWENAKDINELHTKKAANENFEMLNNNRNKVCEIDNHDLHINEHIAFMLGNEYKQGSSAEIEQQFLKHIREHKQMMSFEKSIHTNKE